MDDATNAQLTQASKTVSVVAYTVLYYDFFLTFPTEVEQTWKQGFSCASMLFFGNRYLSLLSHLPLAFMFFGSPSEPTCRGLQIYHGLLLIITQGGVAWMMFLRVYALYHRDCRVAILLATILVTGGGVAVWSIVRTGGTNSVTAPAGCVLRQSRTEGTYFAATWAVMLVFECAVFILTVVRTIRTAVSWRRGLFYLLLRDGSVYFGILIVCYVTNVLMFALAEPGYGGFWTTMTNVLSSVLMTRLTLNIREHMRPNGSQSHVTQDSQLSAGAGRLYRSI